MTSTFLPENAGTTLTLKAESATCWGRGQFEVRNGGESWNICGISKDPEGTGTQLQEVDTFTINYADPIILGHIMM